MKKSVKKCLTALVAVPVAAALLTGCTKGSVEAPFDSNPYAMSTRTYSSETVVSDDAAFGTTIAKPTLAEGSTAAVTSVSNYKDGSTTIVMEGVSQNEYETYKSNYDPDESPTSATEGSGDYSITWVEGLTTNYGTMTINYVPTTTAAAPSTFRTLNLVSGAAENLYIKYIVDSSDMYNMMVDMMVAFGATEQEAETALALQGYTKDNCAMAMEMAARGTDYAVGFYMQDMSVTAAKVGNYLYVTEKGPENLIFEDTTSTAEACVWYKEAYIDGAEDVSGGMSMNLGLVDGEDVYEYAELLGMYTSTGYEIVDGKSYYYEEFSIPVEADDSTGGDSFTTEGGDDEPTYTTVRYYFNGNDLIYAESDGIKMEILISNTIPARLFSTQCPTGYIDYTGRVDA